MFFLLLGTAFAAPLTPGDAVRLGLPFHAQVVEATSALTSAEGAAREAAFLRFNPTLEGGYAVIGDRVDAALSQDLSLSGEGLAARRATRAQVEAAEHRLLRARLEVAAEIRTTWVDAVVAHQRASLAQAAFDLSSRLLAATAARTAAGEASDLDMRLARLEQAKGARDLLEAQAAEGEALLALSAMVHQPVLPEDLVGDPLSAAPAPSTPEGVRSDVLAARAEAESSDANLRRARAAALPPLTLGAFVERDGGELVAGPSLSLTLPLWHQGQAEIGAAAGEAMAARAALASTEARAEADRALSGSTQTRADAVMAQIDAGLDAEAEAALQSIARGNAAGSLDLADTIFLQAEVVEGRAALIEALGAQATARIHALLSRDDTALLGATP